MSLMTVEDKNSVPVYGIMDSNQHLDVSNPNSLVNICSADLRHSILSIPKDYLDRDEKYWKEYFQRKKETGGLGAKDYMFRANFWQEYRRARATQGKLRTSLIWSGVSSDSYFREHIMKCPEKMAFILCPVPDHTAMLHESYERGLEKLREIVTARITTQDGKLDARAAKVALDALMFLHHSIYGEAVQKVMNINAQVTAEDVTKIAAQGDVTQTADGLTRRIKELQSMLKDSPLDVGAATPEPKDEVVIDVEVVAPTDERG